MVRGRRRGQRRARHMVGGLRRGQQPGRRVLARGILHRGSRASRRNRARGVRAGAAGPVVPAASACLPRGAAAPRDGNRRHGLARGRCRTRRAVLPSRVPGVRRRARDPGRYGAHRPGPGARRAAQPLRVGPPARRLDGAGDPRGPGAGRGGSVAATGLGPDRTAPPAVSAAARHARHARGASLAGPSSPAGRVPRRHQRRGRGRAPRTAGAGRVRPGQSRGTRVALLRGGDDRQRGS